MKNKYRVEWVHDFSYCIGHWVLEKNGENISHLIPEDKRKKDMGTLKDYEYWDMDDDDCVVWNTYEDGMTVGKWIEYNKDWLLNVTDYADEWEVLYKLFNENDWRHGCCGACL